MWVRIDPELRSIARRDCLTDGARELQSDLRDGRVRLLSEDMLRLRQRHTCTHREQPARCTRRAQQLQGRAGQGNCSARRYWVRSKRVLRSSAIAMHSSRRTDHRGAETDTSSCL